MPYSKEIEVLAYMATTGEPITKVLLQSTDSVQKLVLAVAASLTSGTSSRALLEFGRPLYTLRLLIQDRELKQSLTLEEEGIHDGVAVSVVKCHCPVQAAPPVRSFVLPPQYSVVKKLGSGRHSDVYLCEDQKNNMKVAVKWVRELDKDAVCGKRTLREIQVLAAMQHDNLLKLVDVLPVSSPNFSDMYIVMPYMRRDLRQVIKARGKLSVAQSKFLTCQILRGLKYLHSAGLAHRELKPSSILVNEDCSLRLANFGSQTGHGLDFSAMNFSTMLWYNALELLLYPCSASEAVDIWSVGCIHFELLAGSPAFPGNNPVEILRIIARTLGVSQKDFDWVPASECDKIVKMIETMGLPDEPTSPLRKRFPNLSEDGVDFLNELLHKEPAGRIAAAAALGLPYLAPLRDPDRETSAPQCLSFTNCGLDGPPDGDGECLPQTLQDHLYAECAKLHPEILARDVAGVQEHAC